ncbi:MAG: hypothetical protein Ta2G_01260 [Termitinemataceae bacterium]|nr:MAG: hypothetical protein Ta2G_01260 [Termitinemataceae bacterium]
MKTTKNGFMKISVLLICLIVLGIIVACSGKKKAAEPKTFTENLEDGLNKLSEVADKYSDAADSQRGTIATTLDLVGYKDLKPQIMGEYIPKIKGSDYPLKKTSLSYATFGLKVLGLKEGKAMKASFNYTITSVEKEKFTIGVEHSDFKSESESESDSGQLSVYYFGDPKEFGANGPTVGQSFLGYVTYHASTIKVGIALPIIVLDGIKLK